MHMHNIHKFWLHLRNFLFCFPKFSSSHDLMSYAVSQSPDNFYGTPLPTLASLSGLDSNLLSGTLSTQGLSDETHRLLQYLDLASRANPGQESAIHDFMREILRVLGYEKRGFLIHSYSALPPPTSDIGLFQERKAAKAHVSLIQGSSTIRLLVILEDATTPSTCDPDVQVTVEANKTFECNNRTRSRLGLPELDSMTIPCIMMIGTRPIFYLVPISRIPSAAFATQSRYSPFFTGLGNALWHPTAVV